MVKIIEAKAIISAQDATGKAFAEVLKKIDSLGKASKAFASAGSKDFGTFAKKIDELNTKAGAIDGFRAQQAAMIAARQQFRAAEQDVQRLGRAMRETAAPTREMTRSYESAQRAVRQASAAFTDKLAAVKAAKAEMAAYGVTLKNIGSQQANVNRFRRGVYDGSGPLTQIPPAAPPAGGGPTVIGGGMKTMGALALAYGASRAHGAVVDKHHDYQQAYLYQQVVLGLNADQQAPLLGQAVKIGQDTKFTNADIVKAQTDIGSKLPKELQSPSTIMGITEHTKNYALAMRVSMEEASVAMVGWMKSRGYDLSSPAAAEKSARRAANQMVEFAKTTGAKHHDLIGDTKFGAAPGRVGGFSEEYANALSAQLMRIGYEGAMAGTFVRAAAMKLSAPTMKGQAAIAAAGLNFDDYVKKGTPMGIGGLDEMLKVKFGRGLSKEQNSKLQQLFNDPEAMGDRGTFSTGVADILNSTFARKTKNGKINANDAKQVSKLVNDFYTLSTGGVDTERLMTDLIRRGMPPAMAKYLFGTEHGGRALSFDPKQLDQDLKNVRNVPENRAEGVANKMQEGSQGAWTRMIGSIETFTVAIGEATDGARNFTYTGIGALFDAMTWFVKGKPGTGVPTDKNPDGSQFFSKNPVNDPALMEQARRRADFVRRDPEAARGEAFQKLTAKVETPIDVTGKVRAELEGKADVNVTVKVEGDGRVTQQGIRASGHVRGSVGTSKAGEYE